MAKKLVRIKETPTLNELIILKIHLMYQLSEVINEVAREIECHLQANGKFGFEDKMHVNQIKKHSDAMSMYAGRVLPMDKAMEFGRSVDKIKSLIYEELNLQESADTSG